MKVISFNANGLRSAESKGWYEWLAAQDADLVCVQETRVQQAQLSARMAAPPGLHGYYGFAARPGYSGVAVYARRAPDRVHGALGWPEADQEGRFLQLDFGRLSVVSLYLPSGSSGPERQAAKFRFMDAFLPWLRARRRSRRHFLVCGDWNIAHTARDLKNWRGNQKNSGFLPEERAWLDLVFGEIGWRDVYRRLHPDAEGEGYTWWSNRGRAYEKNVGWRIDYQVATPGLAERGAAAGVYKERRFSDHAPLIADYDYSF